MFIKMSSRLGWDVIILRSDVIKLKRDAIMLKMNVFMLRSNVIMLGRDVLYAQGIGIMLRNEARRILV